MKVKQKLLLTSTFHGQFFVLKYIDDSISSLVFAWSSGKMTILPCLSTVPGIYNNENSKGCDTNTKQNM